VNASHILERAFAKDPAIEGLRRHVATIQRAARRMNRLIGDLMDAASMDAGTFAVDRAPARVEEMVRETLEAFVQRARDAGIDFQVHAEPGLPELTCDRDRVMQVLGNLVENALKFTPTGGRIRLTAAKGDAGIAFEVSDTGRGIDPEVRDHLYDRVWLSSRLNRDGHGLGLTIVRGIVEAHSGRIEVRSDASHGTSFTITIPGVTAAVGNS
jgi:signal transduction histidine kinase